MTPQDVLSRAAAHGRRDWRRRCGLLAIFIQTFFLWGAFGSVAAAENSSYENRIIPSAELQAYWSKLDHLEAVSLRLAGAADGQCQNRWRHPGVKTHQLADYPRAILRAAVQFADRQPRIRQIDNPALDGLLFAGDQLMGTDGQAVAADDVNVQIQLALGRISVRRDGKIRDIAYRAPLICYRPIRVSRDVEPLARTHRNHIEISQGLLNSFQDEAELAFVLAHELSHYMLGHPQILSEQRKQKKLSPRNRRLLEREADRGAIFLMLRAGFDVRGGPSFIARSSVLREIPLLGLSSHDTRSRRLARLEPLIAWSAALSPEELNSHSVESFVRASAD